MSAALNGVSALLALICFIFYMIATVGYSNEKTTIINVNWFHSYGTGSYENQNVFVGLRRLVTQLPGQDTTSLAYANCGMDDDDDNNFCNVCAREGDSAFGLMALSTILSFIVVGLSVAGIASPSAVMSGANVVIAMLATLFGVIGWGLFVYKCFDKIVEMYPRDMDYGPGAIMSLIAFMLMFIVMILQIVAAILAAKSATPSSTPAPAPVATQEPEATTEL
mmetsp:Transcript_46515/g.92148  ORF Transcript_46515/g.92148 Transcript_46515/m.92148 type:complete len:222 (+) Transcript_46515:76-741(+)|eukprot:CAMPEP_0170376130 /NCGR_PEP_ID=MMETSP0117_2-20130122/11543_1 /TAXON_ID=400756 /ORGANISM="Durinskia baltica, Strain CSIRO CS-38" /LENGTH=221 /DNA_ID=CAMNT_0010631277 /DNA_START=75 /DNA_END=740 /DNA_ORIENTATION=-